MTQSYSYESDPMSQSVKLTELVVETHNGSEPSLSNNSSVTASDDSDGIFDEPGLDEPLGPAAIMAKSSLSSGTRGTSSMPPRRESHFDGLTKSDFVKPSSQSTSAYQPVKGKAKAKAKQARHVPHTSSHEVDSSLNDTSVRSSGQQAVLDSFCPIMGGFCTDGCAHKRWGPEMNDKIQGNHLQLGQEGDRAKVYYVNRSDTKQKHRATVRHRHHHEHSSVLNHTIFGTENPLEVPVASNSRCSVGPQPQIAATLSGKPVPMSGGVFDSIRNELDRASYGYVPLKRNYAYN
eukprot:GHVH01005199.1.p1 GENE.GHVH01005199.1~~GHVH01005199.1.p1  ORF type:complete len:291 (+),score=26.17 GHVH01005199.1:124-996(+)